jgi:hypothetical protein
VGDGVLVGTGVRVEVAVGTSVCVEVTVGIDVSVAVFLKNGVAVRVDGGVGVGDAVVSMTGGPRACTVAVAAHPTVSCPLLTCILNGAIAQTMKTISRAITEMATGSRALLILVLAFRA